MSFSSDDDEEDTKNLTLLTFGYGKNGQLAHGGRESSFYPRRVDFFEGKWAIEIACGDWHTALLTASRQVYAWGSGRNGQLGNNEWVGSLTPVRIESLAAVPVRQVVCGAIHTMVLAEDGHVYSWGGGKEGQLGHGDKESLRVPQMIQPFASDPIVSISAGQGYSAALTEFGCVYTWGCNAEGQLGRPEGDEATPGMVEGLLRDVTVVEVSCGGEHMAGVSETGAIYCWGSNIQGQLGIGPGPADAVSEPRAVELEGDDPAKQPAFVTVSCGQSITAAATHSGECYTWGDFASGQMGLRSRRSPAPERVSELKGVTVVAVSCGSHHFVALDTEGSAFTWGFGGDGRLGLGDDAITLTPLKIEGLPKVLRAEGGRAHTALLIDELEPGPTAASRTGVASLCPAPPLVDEDAPRPLAITAPGINPETNIPCLLARPPPKATPGGSDVGSLAVTIRNGKVVVDPAVRPPEKKVVMAGEFRLSGELVPDDNSEPLGSVGGFVHFENGRLWSQHMSVGAAWDGKYDETTGKVSWESTAGGLHRSYEGRIQEGSKEEGALPDVIIGRYKCSDGTTAAGSFKLEVGAPRADDEDGLLKALTAEEQITAELRRRLEAYKASEDGMRAEVNLLHIDRENLSEEHKELKLRAETAEAKIDRERRLRQDSDDKCERLMQVMIEYKVREEALVRQLKEKETVARKAVEAFNGLRAECATLLKQAAGAAFDDDGGAADELQTKLEVMAQHPSPDKSGN